MYDVIIIGAGPAGLTSALYLLRANKKVLVLEAKSYGGQIINASNVENYPGIESISGFDFATNLYNQVVKLGGEIKFETVIRVEEDRRVITSKNEYNSKVVIIATGAANRKLNIENEEKFIGKGISYCATCDGNFFKNKEVAVNGGGNTALEDAIYLSNLCSKVYLIHRRDEFRGEDKYVEELKNKSNVEFILNSKITSINGSDKLESITINEDKEIKVDGLFIAIGQTPNNKLLDGIVKLNEFGYAVSNDLKTDIDNIYVIGDLREKDLRQLTTAISDGAIVADMIIKK